MMLRGGHDAIRSVTYYFLQNMCESVMLRKGGGRGSELDVTMHDAKRTQFSLEISSCNGTKERVYQTELYVGVFTWDK